jgi:hypothetical protein
MGHSGCAGNDTAVRGLEHNQMLAYLTDSAGTLAYVTTMEVLAGIVDITIR